MDAMSYKGTMSTRMVFNILRFKNKETKLVFQWTECFTKNLDLKLNFQSKNCYGIINTNLLL